MVNSGISIGTKEYLTQYARCRVSDVFTNGLQCPFKLIVPVGTQAKTVKARKTITKRVSKK